MNDVSNFYDELDLKYPEIAIAMEKIDRLNPGIVQFSIPILTPNMDNSKITNNTIHQNSLNLKNKDKKNFEIENINVSNFIKIKVPKSLCIPESYNIIIEGCDLGVFEIIDNGSKIDISLHQTGEFDPNRYSITNISNNTTNMNITKLCGEVKYRFTPEDRFIDAGSKWIVVFIGGDITKPQIIGRYYE